MKSRFLLQEGRALRPLKFLFIVLVQSLHPASSFHPVFQRRNHSQIAHNGFTSRIKALASHNDLQNDINDSDGTISRREMIKKLVLTTGLATVLSGSAAVTKANSNTTTTQPQRPVIEIDSINITQVAIENKINITVKNTTANTKVSIDRKSFTQVEVKETPNLIEWILSPTAPKIVRVKKIPNSELLIASVIAGSATSIVRDGLLYPLSTIKNRIQAKKISRIKTNMEMSFQNILDEFWEQVKQPNLYAGAISSLLVTVPSAGAYFGVRDVTARMLEETIQTPSRYDDLAVSVIGALIADVIALSVRTPVDVFALRKQVATSSNLTSLPISSLASISSANTTNTKILLLNVTNDTVYEDIIENTNDVEEFNEVTERNIVGPWLQDSLERLPAVILTDLPFLLSRIGLNKLVVSENENLAQYSVTYALIACICAALTTPFDVARTRILIDSDNDPTNGLDGGSRAAILQTMVNVTKEGNRNVRGEEIEGNFWNLYAGWLERTIYLGLGMSLLDPIRVIGYLGLRDAILLEWPFNP